MIDTADTIVAIASPSTPALRGIIRLSGEGVAMILGRLRLEPPDRFSRRATRYDAKLDLGGPLSKIPVAIMYWPGRRSYTGQPSAELHTFGSLPILQACLDTAIAAGARAARPGEFTMRAFLAGRLDLTQAEAVLGVIDAEHRGALDHALRQLAGNLSRPLEQMRETMLNLLADVEAGLDFVDEDIEFISDKVLIERLTEISCQLKVTLETMNSRGGASGKPMVVLRGLPNAGKSSLINRLTGQDAAIVTNVAGTTRDIVSVDATIAGREVRIVDTAGIEHAGTDEISRQSQTQAIRASAEADVQIWCVDASCPDFDDSCVNVVSPDPTRRRCVDLWVGTKSDLAPRNELPSPWILTSAVTGHGLGHLIQQIESAISRNDSEEIGSVSGTAARCRETLSDAIRAVDRAISLASTGDGHEFVASELRLVAQCLGEVTGAVYTDDILDRIFSRFCIGK